MSNEGPRLPKREHAENFEAVYANYAYFEPTAWDFKIIFGNVENVSGQDVVKERVAVTIPWAQAKLAVYFLTAHVKAAELQIGKIGIRKDALPAEFQSLTPDEEADPTRREFHEFVTKL